MEDFFCSPKIFKNIPNQSFKLCNKGAGCLTAGLIVKSILVVLLQLVARSCEERYQEVMKELQALKKVKKKLGNLEEEIGSLYNTNKVRLVA